MEGETKQIKHTLYDICFRYWEFTHRGQQRILDVLRSGELDSSIESPFEGSSLIPVPTDVWKDLPDNRFRVRYKKNGSYKKPREAFSISADFAIQQLLAEIAQGTSLKLSSDISTIIPSDLQSFPDGNVLDLLDKNRETLDLLRAGAHLEKIRQRKYIVYVTEDKFNKFWEMESSVLLESENIRRYMTENDMFWLEILKFSRKVYEGNKNNHLMKHMDRWSSVVKFKKSKQYIADRVVEANGIIKGNK